MLTVYFDTRFYLELGEAEEDEAARVLAELDRAGVRQVRSPRVYAELARAPEQAETHARAVARLARAQHPALELAPGLDWGALGPGPARTQIAEQARALDDAELYLRAVCRPDNHGDGYRLFLGQRLGDAADEALALIHALDPDLPVRAYNAALRHKTPDVVRELGEVEAAGDLAVNHTRILRHNAELVFHGLRGGGFEPPPPPELEGSSLPESITAFGTWMAAALGPEAMAFVEHGLGLIGDPRLVSNPDPSGSRARLADALADQRHIPLFASFADEIDLLQLDAPSLAELRESGTHYLHPLGLGQRCFASNNGLAGVLDAVRACALG
jgi:hypothetical protein